jgi:signal transduction histidine kinase
MGGYPMGLRLPIKVKVAAALCVPLAFLLVVAVLEVERTTRDARLVREQTDLATAAIGPSGVITALQNERNFTGLWLLGSPDAIDLPVDTLAQARSETDASVAAFRDEVERKGGETARAYAPAIAAIDDQATGLRSLRTTVDAYDGPRLITQFNPTADASFAGYSELVEALADPTTELSRTIEDGELRQGVVLIDLGSRQVNHFSWAVRDSLLMVVQGDGHVDEPDEVRKAAVRSDRAEEGDARILRLSEGAYQDLGEKLEADNVATGARPIFRQMIETGEVDIPGLLEAVSIEDDESYYGFIHQVSERIRERADELNAAATTRQRLVLAVALLLVLASALAVPLVSRSISGPLLALARQARDLAVRRLPEAVRQVQDTPAGADVTPPELEAIRVRSRDEVADVAVLLNSVQETAVSLAVEQAALRRNGAEAFMSLARRNQNLLTRQIDYITNLLTHESDAQALDNLFNLDQQATRMRRNAESLLVLGGAPALRHSAAPAPLLDVVRAALGEVNEYPLVRVTGVAPAVIDGPVVADLSHLLAELIENALRASPRGVPVEIRGHGGANSYALGIVDHGPGMPAAELERANRRMAEALAHTVAPSEYLGQYVTGILAARHGITVKLQPTLPTGVTAVVRLPARLLVVSDKPGARVPLAARVAAGPATPSGPGDAPATMSHAVVRATVQAPGTSAGEPPAAVTA